MKLKSVRIRNFRLLKDVRIEFSGDPQRPLTVIRAENGCGKTSTLIALRWALYGEKGLEDPLMRLSPTSWPFGQECEISVQLDFSHTLYNVIAGESVGTATDYRLVRAATERPEGDAPNRLADRVTLFQYGDAGLDKIASPELRIEEILPLEMKDIFFTDGDAALTFISPQLTKATRHDQVKEAIRSLLGLGLLENSAAHIAVSKRHFNSEISKLSGSGELSEITRKINEAEDGQSREKERLRDVDRQIEDLARRHEDADKRLQLALQAGDYEELEEQQRRARAQLADARQNEPTLKERHRQILQDERLSLALLGTVLEAGFGELAKLHQAGVIPSGSISVLEERLELRECVCGASLTEGSDARRHVEHLIATQRTVDDKRKVLTELYHAAKVDLQRGNNAASDWILSLASLERTRLTNRKAITNAQDQLKICKQKIEQIDRVGINEVRKDRDSLLAALTAKQDERRDCQTVVDGQQRTIDELTPRQAELRHQDQRLDQLNSRLTVTEDMAMVVRGVLEDLGQVYLAQVARRLNELFLEMVGADPARMRHTDDGTSDKPGQVIIGAAITENYEIVVYSNDNTTLNPQYELSGAQKRALTFSFIWALTEVSQVIAPRLIDTPLGMMSGLVKKRVIELITAPSLTVSDIEKQVVLFLTRDEIQGVEAVIDARAGSIVTFTNSAHFPVAVVNDPVVEVPQILTCGCSHRQYCRLCALQNDRQYGLIERKSP